MSPVLKVRDPNTGNYVPVTGASVNEVTIGGTTPVDGSDLWLDTVASPLTPQFLTYGPRNKVINGDFSVNQRAFTSTTTAFGHDRWRLSVAGGTVTYSAQTPAVGELPESARSYARVVSAGQAATTDYAQLIQFIEGVRTLSGKTVTASFWARAASGTPKVSVEFDQSFGGGGGSGTVLINGGQVTLSTVWTRYSVTVAIPSIAGKTVGTVDDSFIICLWTSSGSAYNARTGSMGIQNTTIDFWGVQVEEGSNATAFEQKSYAEELRNCQRYFHRAYAGTPYGRIGIARGHTTSSVHCLITLPVPMRVIPTSVAWDTGSITIDDGATSFSGASAIPGTSSSLLIATLMLTVTPATVVVGKFYEVTGHNSPYGGISVNAEF